MPGIAHALSVAAMTNVNGPTQRRRMAVVVMDALRSYYVAGCPRVTASS
jgi:hypothetical protein